MEERFSRLKDESLKREVEQQEEHNKQVQQLTQEVLRAKREFEEHLQVRGVQITELHIYLSTCSQSKLIYGYTCWVDENDLPYQTVTLESTIVSV